MDLQPFLQTWLYPTIALTLAALGGWVLVRSQAYLASRGKWLDANAQTQIADLEKRALQMGTDAVMQWVQTNGNKLHPTLDSGVTTWAANLALSHAGGILAKNGLSPQEVADKIVARLPMTMVTTDTTGRTVPKAVAVEVEPLPPISTDPAKG